MGQFHGDLHRKAIVNATKYVVYAAIVTALHEIIDLKHRSPHFRLNPLDTQSPNQTSGRDKNGLLLQLCLNSAKGGVRNHPPILSA